MKTACPECDKTYKVRRDFLGRMARCPKCQTLFAVEPVVDLVEEDVKEEDKKEEGKPKRQTSKEMMNERIMHIRDEIDGLIPYLELSLDRRDNESDTRMLIDRVLTNALGYNIPEIKTEQKIEGRKADYVLAIKDQEKLIIEAKRIGMGLRETQVFQASGYAAHSGIPWVVLTNAMVWQLYRVSFGERITTDLVFTIDLRDGLDGDEEYYFYLISRWGMARKGLLEKTWREISALCYDNLMSAILDEKVVARVRSQLNKKYGVRLNADRVREAIEAGVFQLF